MIRLELVLIASGKLYCLQLGQRYCPGVRDNGDVQYLQRIPFISKEASFLSTGLY
jgi:hypothetical protein